MWHFCDTVLFIIRTFDTVKASNIILANLLQKRPINILLGEYDALTDYQTKKGSQRPFFYLNIDN